MLYQCFNSIPHISQSPNVPTGRIGLKVFFQQFSKLPFGAWIIINTNLIIGEQSVCRDFPGSGCDGISTLCIIKKKKCFILLCYYQAANFLQLKNSISYGKDFGRVPFIHSHK